MNSSDAQNVARIASEYLKNQHPSGLKLEVEAEGGRDHSSWWQVPVRPNAWPNKTFELYDTLAEVETKILEEHHLNVLFSLMEPKAERAA